MTCGFFGGTFDPVHLGHMALAKQFLKQVDHVLFCPAHVSPFKMKTPPEASSLHRLNMLKIALRKEPRFSITTCELERKAPSYTIDTILFLKESMQENFFLILSEEGEEGLTRWKEASLLLKLAPPLIGKHTSIRSRDIREKLKKGVDCSHEIDEEVLDYIREHQLYSSTL